MDPALGVGTVPDSGGVFILNLFYLTSLRLILLGSNILLHRLNYVFNLFFYYKTKLKTDLPAKPMNLEPETINIVPPDRDVSACVEGIITCKGSTQAQICLLRFPLVAVSPAGRLGPAMSCFH